MRVAQEIHLLGKPPEPQQQNQGGHQVRPNVDGFIMLLEEREEVILPGSVEWPVPCVNVGLPKEARDIRHPDRAGGSRKGVLQEPRHFPEVLRIDKKMAEFFGHNSCHDKRAQTSRAKPP